MWYVAEGGRESVEQCVVVDDSVVCWPFPFRRGYSLYMRCRNRLGLNWWSRDQLNQKRLEHQLKRFRVKPQKAWVVCKNEWDASTASALLQGLGNPPFVLHVLDIFHDVLSEDNTPAFRRLIRTARHVLCLSDNIAEAMRSAGAQSLSLLPFCSDLSANGRQPLGSPVRIVMTGSIWQDAYKENAALSLLVGAWPAITRKFPGCELHYSGLSGKFLPEELRCDIRNHGALDHAAYQDLLRTCHVAYAPVSHPSTSVGRFSIPSRIGDYLACGLPTITCTDQGTAIASFVRSLPALCACNVGNTSDLLTALEMFVGDATRWGHASAAASTYAREHLAVSVVSAELFRQLEQC